MRPTRRHTVSMALATAAVLLAGAGRTAARAEEPDPAPELVVLFSGAIQGNLEPCG